MPFYFGNIVNKNLTIQLPVIDLCKFPFSELYSFDYDTVLPRLRIRPINRDRTERAHRDPLIACGFARCLNNGHILASSNDSGMILVQDSRSVKTSAKVNRVHKAMVFGLAWSDIDMKLVTGSADHNASIWDVSPVGKLTRLSVHKRHTFSVKSVAFKPQSTEIFVSCGRDGLICVWDSRSSSKNPETVITSKKYQGNPCSITDVLFRDDNFVMSTDDANSEVKIWDIRRSYTNVQPEPQPICRLKNPAVNGTSRYSNMVSNKNRTMLYAVCNTCIDCYDLNSGKLEPVLSYDGYDPITSNRFLPQCALSCDEKYLACTNGESDLYVWKVGRKNALISYNASSLTGSNGLDWSRNGDLKIAVCTDEYYPLIFEPFYKYDNTDQLSWHKTVAKKREITSTCNKEFISYDSVKIRTKAKIDDDNISNHKGSDASKKRKKSGLSSCASVETVLYDRLDKQKTVVFCISDDALNLSEMLKDLPNSIRNGNSLFHRCSRKTINVCKTNWLTSLCQKYKFKEVTKEESSASPKHPTKLFENKKRKLTIKVNVTPSPKRKKDLFKVPRDSVDIKKYFSSNV